MIVYDYLIVGAGIIGLSIARELRNKFPGKTICIIEKEEDVAMHSSGRNSGVLHAGFYYSADSLKARFTKDGNQEMIRFCVLNNIQVNKCGKLVVATNEEELKGLEELKHRGDKNGVELHWLGEKEIQEIEPKAKTYKKALYSPTTASVDPIQVCQVLKQKNLESCIDIFYNTKYLKWISDEELLTSKGIFKYRFLINAAGLYADKLAHDYGYGKEYTILPFKGVYLKYNKNKTDIKTNIYPVPNLKNPFLGVHFTKTFDGSIKIGPTAIPAFWRENYTGFKNIKTSELLTIFGCQTRLFISNSFSFRNLALEEIKKYNKNYLIKSSLRLVREIDPDGFGEFLRPGIRAQLLNKKTWELVQDFVIEGNEKSIHILNAVSPAFTCSIPFSKYVVSLLR